MKRLCLILSVLLVFGLLGCSTVLGPLPARVPDVNDPIEDVAIDYDQFVKDLIEVNKITIQSWPHTSGWLHRALDGRKDLVFPAGAMKAWELMDGLALAYDKETGQFDLSKIPEDIKKELQTYTLYSEEDGDITQYFLWGYNQGGFAVFSLQTVLNAVKLFAPDVWNSFLGVLPGLIAGTL
jgi:hypothetical protein